MVDAAGTTVYGYSAGGQLWTEDGPFDSDTVTNTYQNRLRVALSLGQPTGGWTNAFGYDAAKGLTALASPAGTFTYTLGGSSSGSPLPEKIALPNSAYITNTYNFVDRRCSAGGPTRPPQTGGADECMAYMVQFDCRVQKLFGGACGGDVNCIKDLRAELEWTRSTMQETCGGRR